jgi:hypothetical protein
MSVKKIGKALIEYSARYGGVHFRVEGYDGYFITNEEIKPSEEAKLLEIPSRPEDMNFPEPPPEQLAGEEYVEFKKRRNAFYESNIYKQAKALYDTKVKEYDKKLKQISQAFIVNFVKEYTTKTLRLKFLDSGKAFLYCYYKEYIYKFDRPGYTDEEMLLQVMDFEDGERKKFERLKHKFSVARQEEKEGGRPAIPEEVRIAVWRRDEGKCVKCGSREKLEYDHIIPISKGGSNTVRNIELLCEKCNREKSDNI